MFSPLQSRPRLDFGARAPGVNNPPHFMLHPVAHEETYLNRMVEFDNSTQTLLLIRWILWTCFSTAMGSKAHTRGGARPHARVASLLCFRLRRMFLRR